MKSGVHRVWLLVLLFCASACCAQSVNDLEQKIASLNAEIELANKLLGETSKDKKTTIAQVELLNKKIKQRQQLIKAYQSQINKYSKQIKEGEAQTGVMRSQLAEYRKDYSRLIESAYRNRSSYSTLSYLLSADNFNQAYRRLHYLKQMTEFRKAKIDQIVEAEAKLDKKISDTREEKSKKQKALTEVKKEKQLLDKEKKTLNKQVSELQKKEKSIRKQINEKQSEAKKLKETIEKIIAAEIAAAEEAGKAKSEMEMNLTPEEKILSDAFGNCKGKLPMPTAEGVVSVPFGKRQHPVMKKVTVTNNGIDILVPANSDAWAVYEGTVVSVSKITGVNNAVIIRHGAYFTVYSNLDVVYVKRGDKVKTKQAVGHIHTNTSEQKTELHFELWVGKKFVDPETWIAK